MCTLNIPFSLEPLGLRVVLALTIVGIILLMKKRGIFSEKDCPVFERLVTEIALPVIIYGLFLHYSAVADSLVPAGILLLVLIISLGVAYGISRLLNLSQKMTGTFVMVSAFGSTATLAAPLIQDVLTSGPWAGEMSGYLPQAITIGNIGVSLPFFTLGILITSYFGEQARGESGGILRVFREFITTPIFIAFLLGVITTIILSSQNVPGVEIYSDFFADFIEVISSALDLLIWITIGLMIRPIKVSQFIPLLLLCIAIKMIFQPLCAIYLGMAVLTPVEQNITLLFSAMPSGAVAAIFASRYGCDGSLAGWLVIGTYLAAVLTVPLLFLLA